MSCESQHCLEAARASALAAHSAAGLASAAGLRTVARLLRSSEALSRSAVAALLAAAASQRSGSLPVGAKRPRPGAGRGASSGAAGASVSASRPRRRRPKKKNVTKEKDMVADDVADVCSVQLALVDSEPPYTTTATLPADVGASGPGERPRRVLAAKTSRERSPRRPSSPASSSPACPPAAVSADPQVFAVGQAAVLASLVSRPELSGLGVTVRSFDGASGRYAVSIDSSGESVRVLAKNLVKPCVITSSGAG